MIVMRIVALKPLKNRVFSAFLGALLIIISGACSPCSLELFVIYVQLSSFSEYSTSMGISSSAARASSAEMVTGPALSLDT